MCFLVNIAKFFHSKPPVASVDLLFLIKSNMGWFLLKRVDLVIVRVRMIKLQKPKTCPKWITVAQAIWSDIKILTVFFDFLIANISWTVAQTPIRHIIFWITVIKTSRSMHVNCFNPLRFLAEVSTKLQKIYFFGQFKDHNSGRKHRNLWSILVCKISQFWAKTNDSDSPSYFPRKQTPWGY